MALFGRESEKDARRAERIREWAQARSPYTLFAFGASILSVVDSITMVIGIAAGIAAIILSLRGRRDLQCNPELTGHRLNTAALVIGCIGVVLSCAVFVVTRII